MQSLDGFLEAIKELKKAPPISTQEYWKRVNKISAEEQIAFLQEEKKLIMNEELFHRRFTI